MIRLQSTVQKVNSLSDLIRDFIKGGSAAYAQSVNITNGHIGSTLLMSYHTPSRSSADFIKVFIAKKFF